MVGWVDGHAHLDRLNVSPQEALQKARQTGVYHVIHVCIEPENWLKFERWESWGPGVWVTVGLHPQEAHLWNPEWRKQLAQATQHPQVIALGEMGLDYVTAQADAFQQRQVFEEQLSLAAELGLPVQIHSRQADSDLEEILKAWKGQVTGVLHCFTGSWELARKALDWGFRVSLSGIVTFKNAPQLREIVRQLPPDGWLIETDSPFLSPHPWRGQPNEPFRVAAIGEFLAHWLGVEPEQLQTQLMQNLVQTYPKWRPDWVIPAQT